MNRLRKRMVPILTGLFCLALLGPVFSQEMTAGQLVSAVSQKWSNIKDFQGDMNIGMQMFGTMMKMNGTMWGANKLFRMEMTLPPEMMPGGNNKSTGPMKILLVFDGKTMWQSMPTMNMVTKVDYSALETLKSMPSSGFRYALPDVPYELSEKKRDGTDYYFLKTKDITKFIQKSGMSGMGVNLPANMPFKDIGVWINKATLFPDLTEFYFQDGAAPGLYIEFKNVKVDQGIAPELFTFKVPEGAQVMDMTEATRAMIKKMKQSTASDTAQATNETSKTPPKQSTSTDTAPAQK